MEAAERLEAQTKRELRLKAIETLEAQARVIQILIAEQKRLLTEEGSRSSTVNGHCGCSARDDALVSDN